MAQEEGHWSHIKYVFNYYTYYQAIKREYFYSKISL